MPFWIVQNRKLNVEILYKFVLLVFTQSDPNLEYVRVPSKRIHDIFVALLPFWIVQKSKNQPIFTYNVVDFTFEILYKFVLQVIRIWNMSYSIAFYGWNKLHDIFVVYFQLIFWSETLTYEKPIDLLESQSIFGNIRNSSTIKMDVFS